MTIFRRSGIVLLGLSIFLTMFFAKDTFASNLDDGKQLLLDDMDIVGAHAKFDAASPDQVTSFWRAATIAAQSDLLKNKLQALGIFNLSDKLNVFDAEGEENYNAEAAVDNIILDNDNDAVDYSGAWDTLIPPDPSNPYGDNCRYHDAGTGTNTVTWEPNIAMPGYYGVNVWVSAAESNTDAAKYRINHVGGYTDVTMNQKGSGHAHWRYLGEYKFNSGTAGSIVLSDASSTGRVVADAVKLEYQGIIVDDTDPGFSLTSSGWVTVTGDPAESRDGNYRLHSAGTGAGASWTVDIPNTGLDYLVYAMIPPKGPLSGDVAYTVSNVVGGPVKTIHVDQNSAIGMYCLGKFRFTSATGTVTLSSSASGKVVADAIRIVPCRPYPDLTEAQTIDNGLLTEIDAAILDMSNLDNVNKDFSDVITSAHCSDMSEDLYIDYGDAKMLEAVLYLTRMYIKINAAYEQASVDMQPLIVNEGDLDTAQRILDEYTMFLTGGAAVALGEAKAALINAIDSYTLASEFIRDRTDSNDHLVAFYSPGQPQEEKDEALEIEGNFRNLSADIMANLTDPENNESFTINLLELFGTDDGPPGICLDMNLDAFFSDPKNMRSFIDMLRTNSGLVLDHTSDPSFDPTLGGILPNMKNEDWNYLFGNGPEILDISVTWSGDTPSVSIEWDKSKDPNAAGITHYEIYRGTDASMTDGVSIGTVGSPDTTQFTDPSLPPTGNTFYYRVYTYYDAVKGTAATYTEAEKVVLRLYVNINGSSTIEDGTKENPIKDLSDAIRNYASGGTRVCVAAGTYDEYGNTLGIWSSKSGLVLEGGYNGTTWQRDVANNETIIDASNYPDSPGINIGNVNNITIDGLTITNATGPQTWTSGVQVWHSQGAVIRNCKIINCNRGIGIDSGSTCLVDNCYIEGRGNVPESGEGVTVNSWDAAASAEIRNCVIKDFKRGIASWHNNFAGLTTIKNNLVRGNYLEGINASGSASTLVITNNTIIGNQNNGIGYGWWSTAGVTIKDNIAANNTGRGIICYSGNAGTVTHNDAYENSSGGYGNISPLDPTNKTANPLFVDAANGDYHLQTSSPCVDAGSDTAANLGLSGMTTRTDNVTDSSIVDMGYHYFVSADDIVIDFGDPYGIWVRYNNSTWGQLHYISPESITTGDIDGNGKDDIIIDFGDPYGIWVRYNDSTWGQLHYISPKSIITGDIDGNGKDDIIIDFGLEYGIWVRYNNSTWSQLHYISAKSITTGDIDGNGKADIVIDFGDQYGIWVRYNNSTWGQLHYISAKSITTGDIDGNGKDDIVIDFGDQYGIWVRYNDSTWSQLHYISAKSITTGDIDGNGKADIVVDFGDPYGIWVRYNDSTWGQLHYISAKSITTGDIDGNGKDDIIVDFGLEYGIWVRYNDSTWGQLHYISPDSMVTGLLD